MPDNVEDDTELLEVYILVGESSSYDKFMYEGHHDTLSSTLSVIKIFAVNPNAITNVEDVDFYLVNCIKQRRRLERGILINGKHDWLRFLCFGRIALQASRCM